MVKLHSR